MDNNIIGFTFKTELLLKTVVNFFKLNISACLLGDQKHGAAVVSLKLLLQLVLQEYPPVACTALFRTAI